MERKSPFSAVNMSETAQWVRSNLRLLFFRPIRAIVAALTNRYYATGHVFFPSAAYNPHHENNDSNRQKPEKKNRNGLQLVRSAPTNKPRPIAARNQRPDDPIFFDTARTPVCTSRLSRKRYRNPKRKAATKSANTYAIPNGERMNPAGEVPKKSRFSVGIRRAAFQLSRAVKCSTSPIASE